MLELGNLKREKDYGMGLTGNSDQNEDGSGGYKDNNYVIEDPDERFAGNNEAFSHMLKIFKGNHLITICQN